MKDYDIFFDEDEHLYLVDGRFVPSVTDVLSPLHSSYSRINPYVLDRAAIRGTAVHEACEAIDLGLEPEIYPETEGYVRAYLDWQNVYRPEWEAIEQIVYNDKMDYIGTADRIGRLNGTEPAVVDIKTSSPAKESLVSVCLQTFAYKEAYFGEKACKRYGLFLKADGSWRFLDCAEYEKKNKFEASSLWWTLLYTHIRVAEALGKRKEAK